MTIDNTAFSSAERMILRNQFAILELLTAAAPTASEEEAKTKTKAVRELQRHQYALENGYDTRYADFLRDQRAVPRLSIIEQREIEEILWVWATIQLSYDKAIDKEGLTETEIEFPGWHTKDQANFAAFFVGPYLFADGDSDRALEANGFVRPSPSRVGLGDLLDKYRAMARIRKKYEGRGANLTIAEIREVLAPLQ